MLNIQEMDEFPLRQGERVLIDTSLLKLVKSTSPYVVGDAHGAIELNVHESFKQHLTESNQDMFL